MVATKTPQDDRWNASIIACSINTTVRVMTSIANNQVKMREYESSATTIAPERQQNKIHTLSSTPVNVLLNSGARFQVVVDRWLPLCSVRLKFSCTYHSSIAQRSDKNTVEVSAQNKQNNLYHRCTVFLCGELKKYNHARFMLDDFRLTNRHDVRAQSFGHQRESLGKRRALSAVMLQSSAKHGGESSVCWCCVYRVTSKTDDAVFRADG